MIFRWPSRKPCCAALIHALPASRKTMKAETMYLKKIDLNTKK
jgi:hypothetical protein